MVEGLVEEKININVSTFNDSVRVGREGMMDRCSCHGRRCIWCLDTTSNANSSQVGTSEGEDWEDISLE